MNKLVKILEKLIRDSKKTREWKSFIFCLSAIVVFTTTYALILPAITVEKSKTDSVGGLVVEEADPGSTGAGAEASEGVRTVGAKNEIPDETVQEEAAGNTAAVADEEVREPFNGEVLTVGDKKIMTLTGEEFDVVVSSDLSAGVTDGTVLSVRGIQDADVAKSFSDRISDELLKLFVDTKSTEILYRLVFTDTDFVEYTPEGYFDVEFIFHDNTIGSDGEMIYAPRFDGENVYAAVYDYLTDEMILAEKNGDEYETPVISLDEYGVITNFTLKGLDFYEYSDIITLVGGPVNEELKRAAEKTESSAVAENGTESTDGKKESADAKTASAESKSDGSSEKDKKSAESKEFKSGTLSTRGSDYSVRLVYSAEAEIPDKSVLEVTEIETGTSAYEKYLEQAKAAIGLDKDQVLPQEQARFFDIRIMADGKEVQPAANVNVSIAYDTPVVESDPRTDSQIDVSAVHFGKKGAEVVEVGEADARSVEFEAESFSIYGVIYTVDFHYDANGKMYDFSIPGGGFVTMQQLVEVLGIANGDAYGENTPNTGETAEALSEKNEENGTAEEQAAGDTGAYAEDNGSEGSGEEQSAENNDAHADTANEEIITLNNVTVSEATKNFVADIADVKFSNSELVWVGKTEESTTVGQLKKTNGLECQYSVKLTEEQIGEINGSSVEAGDWVLISVQSFISDETLTVTMKNGDQFVIKVSDGQQVTEYAEIDKGIHYMIMSPKVGKSRLRQLSNACSLTTEYSL